MKKLTFASVSILLASICSAGNAHALEQIIRPYQSVRSSGMGGVHITTGLYDENFFGNPARVTANPKWRVTLLDPMVEFNSTTLDTKKDLTSGGEMLTKVGNTAGKNNHGRVQTTMPSVYLPHRGKWSYAFGIIQSSQFDLALRRSFQLSPQSIVDIGPALTVGRTLLKDNNLSVGMTSHLVYRLASRSNYGFTDLIHGESLSPLKSGGDMTTLDFDVGSTYRFPNAHFMGFDYTVGASINNILDGKTTAGPNPDFAKGSYGAPNQPRTFNVGASATRPSFWKLGATTLAFEITDIGNNPNGSMFRTVHMGGETTWSVFKPRLGLNQGYLAGGLGIQLKVVEIDLATYAEEMSLNVGGWEDRRYAIRLAFQI